MKDFWLNKEECTGCGACENICPQRAITMKADECGFKYPVINEKCVDCNLCEKICNKRKENVEVLHEEPRVYAAWSLDPDVRFSSTSGGIFSEIAKQILKNGGKICGAVYNDDNLVEHAIVDTKKGLEKIRQSKYIQSDINDIYTQIKDSLIKGEYVAFCGAPCQVAGLNAFLGKSYDNLLLIDFICRGMNSPKAYKAWLNEIEQNYGSKVTRVWFKYKNEGWKKSPKCTRVDFENGENKVFRQEENLFMSGYLGPNLYIRPVCANCDFKGVKRQSDITLADFWGIDKALDDDMGTSLVMINSPKGQEAFDRIKESIFFKELKLNDIMDGNVCFENSVRINPKSGEFLRSLDEKRFSNALRKYEKGLFIKKMIKKFRRR